MIKSIGPGFKGATLIVLLAAVSAATASPDIDSILIRTVGGPAAADSIRALETYTMRGEASINGLAGVFEAHFQAPNRSYLRLEVPLFTLVQAFDGQTAWQQDHTGQISEVKGLEKSEIISGLFFDSFSHLLPGRIEGGRQYAGMETVDGRRCYQIDFYPEYRDTVSLFVDSAGGRVVMTRQTLDELPAETRFTDYRKAGGSLWPFRSSMRTIGAPLEMIFEYHEVTPNDNFNPDIFAMPGSRQDTYHFPPGQDSLQIPVIYVDGHLYVEVTLRSRRVWMILDSGASATMINAVLAEQLGLQPTGSLPAKGMSGYEAIDLVRIDSLAVGELWLGDLTAGIVDLSGLAGDIGPERRFGGILGYDFLSRFPLSVDYRQPRITIYHPERFVLPPSGAEIPFHLTLQVPTISANLAGATGDFIVDLGNPFGLLVHDAFIGEHRLDTLLSEVRPLNVDIGGIGGQVSARAAQAPSLLLGEVLISPLSVVLIDREAGLAGSGALAGNIGNLVLEDFRVLFDYRSQRIVLYPTESE